ncbi:MAG: ferric reductase-like transmembrane domain-containing protein [Egibacteraceae bacterium]
MTVALRGMMWAGVYLAAIAAPLFFVLIGAPEGRGWWADLSMALGFIAMAMLGLQLVVTARLPQVEAPFGLDVVLQYHRQISYVILAFVLLHPAMLIVQDPSLLALLNPATATTAALWGLASVALLLVLLALSIWRTRLGLSYEVWRVSHGLLAIGVVATAFVHIERVGYYVSGPLARAVWFAVAAGLIGALAYVRLVKPLRRRKRPYRVTAVAPQPCEAWSLSVEPDGHRGLRFLPGQFAWLTIGRSPFSVKEHPFSFSSAATDPSRLEFTIKALGDDTARIGEVEPGTRVYLDGPYGAFSYTRSEAAGFVFLAGGVGITPIISMLRTLADLEDQRPMHLLYACRSEADLLFGDELDALTERLDLTVTTVLEEPGEGWTGPQGVITPELLDERLPTRPRRYAYFLCGPPAMMDVLESELAARKVPPERVNLERFDLI